MDNRNWKITLDERFPETEIVDEHGITHDTIQLCLNTVIKDDKPYSYISVEIYTKCLKYGPHEFTEIKRVHLLKKFETLSEATEYYNNLQVEDYKKQLENYTTDN
jgi:hypothetical protein